MRCGCESLALVGWLPLPALRFDRPLRRRARGRQAVPVQWLPPPNFADFWQLDGAHDAAADNLDPVDLPSQPSQDMFVGAGAQAPEWRQLPHNLAVALKDQQRNGQARLHPAARRYGSNR